MQQREVRQAYISACVLYHIRCGKMNVPKYCNDGFIEMDDLLNHKQDCKKAALNLKSSLHQAAEYLEGQLVSSPENHLLEDEWKRMKECLALVSYKLLINEQIKLNDFSM